MMIYVTLTVLAAIVIAANVYLHKSRHSRWKEIDESMTATGETFGERKAYHQRGELSPGEHALAKAIREHVGKPPLAE